MRKRPSGTQGVDLDLLRNRHPKAVERWFLKHADALYTFVFYRVGKDEELATDVVQDTFVTALGKIDEYDPQRGAMWPWLTYTCRNCIRKALKQKGRYQPYSEFWEKIDRRLLAAYRGLATSPLSEDVLERQETAELVHMALSNIPDNYQQALRRHYYQRQSLEDMARSDGMTAGAVKSLLYRARLAFKTAFQTIVGALEDQHPARRTVQ